MLEDLRVYKEIVEAIRISKANLDLEVDMNDVYINKELLENKLINDFNIQNKAKEKVKKFYE